MRRHQSAPGLRLELHASSEAPRSAALAALTELLAPDRMDGSETAKVSLALGQVGFCCLPSAARLVLIGHIYIVSTGHW